MRKRREIMSFYLSVMFVALTCIAFIMLSRKTVSETNEIIGFVRLRPFLYDFHEEIPEIVEDDSLNVVIHALDEGDVIFNSSSNYYRYGPSIIEHEDGSMDAWFSAPGNNKTEWDWITYRHSDDGENWSKEKVVLKPTANSKDRCSVCDPGVIFFDGYYYLAYTSTADAGRKGYNNSAFVCRSRNPQGPYEKWNGKGWGGKPEPFIAYEEDPRGWGIGEVSFVIRNNELYIYYTYFNATGGYTALKKAQLVDDWPLTMEDYGSVCGRTSQDSFDVVYDDDLHVFMAFAIENRMSPGSKVTVYTSEDGTNFVHADSTKKMVDDYAHNLGIAKSEEGHISSNEQQLVGYAFGRRWGRWSTRFQHIEISNPVRYKLNDNSAN